MKRCGKKLHNVDLGFPNVADRAYLISLPSLPAFFISSLILFSLLPLTFLSAINSSLSLLITSLRVVILESPAQFSPHSLTRMSMSLSISLWFLTAIQASPPVQRPTLIQPWRGSGFRILLPLKNI